MTDTPVPDVDRMISVFSGKLRTIYEKRTAGDHTFSGFLAEFLAAVEPVIRQQVAEEIAEKITDNVRNEDWSKQDRGGFYGNVPKMAYVAGHDRAAAIARSHSTPKDADHE